MRRGFEVVRNEGQRGLLAGASSFGRMGCHYRSCAIRGEPRVAKGKGTVAEIKDSLVDEKDSALDGPHAGIRVENVSSRP